MYQRDLKVEVKYLGSSEPIWLTSIDKSKNKFKGNNMSCCKHTSEENEDEMLEICLSRKDLKILKEKLKEGLDQYDGEIKYATAMVAKHGNSLSNLLEYTNHLNEILRAINEAQGIQEED